eukprot:15555301-Heterocapsa_arctica.AAC.1
MAEAFKLWSAVRRLEQKSAIEKLIGVLCQCQGVIDMVLTWQLGAEVGEVLQCFDEDNSMNLTAALDEAHKIFYESSVLQRDETGEALGLAAA